MRPMPPTPMKALQAFGLVFVLIAGLVLGITEPWSNATQEESTNADEGASNTEIAAPDNGTEQGVAGGEQTSEPAPTPRSEQCLDSHNALAMHIHPRLELVVDGQNITVPDDLGIDTSACVQAMHLLHSHDASGKLHIEGYETFTPTADLIFEVWNISYPQDDSLRPLFDDPTNVTVTVDGAATDADWHEVVLKDGETLRVVHSTESNSED